MRATLFVLPLALLCTTAVLADSTCPGGCPTIPIVGGTSNNGTNTGNVQGIANPTGVISNNNVNVNQVGSQLIGSTQSNCTPDTISPYVQQSWGGGFGGYNSSYTTAGIIATISLNHSAFATCMEGARLLVQQRRNDTVWGNTQQCVNLWKNNVDLRSPALNHLCDGIIIAPPQVVQAPAPPPQIINRDVLRIVTVHTPSCITDSHAESDLFYLHTYHREYLHGLRKLHPSQRDLELQALHDHLARVCGVTPLNIWNALDG